MTASLYFHIPFCAKKCSYCHFFVLPEEEAAKDLLLKGFFQEIDLIKEKLSSYKIVSLYFGGGTPSLFHPRRLAALIERVRECFSVAADVEITLEANPENITALLMQDYRLAGVNRVSIGVQSLDDDLLKLLGREHSADKALEAVEMTYQAGIHNLSIDLMYDLPHQTLEHWNHTLDKLAFLPLSHLSLYNLTIEPHTLFFKQQKTLSPFLPSEEVSLEMIETAVEKLEKMGLRRYEISAFAKPGCESRHNSGYWTGRPFWGLGPSAFSYMDGRRFQNIPHLNKYLRQLEKGELPHSFEEELTAEARARELFVLRLRLLEGVSPDSLDTLTRHTLDRLVKEGLLEEDYRLSLRGRLFYDEIAAELI